MCLCSIENFLGVLGKKWSLLIINEIKRSKKIRYSKLNSKLEGISPSILTSMLRQLEQMDIIERKIFNEIPPKVEYSLSKKGKEFQKLLEPLVEWTKNYDNIHCKCNLEQNSNLILKLKEKSIKKLIEASVCACGCCMIHLFTQSLPLIGTF